MSKYLGFDKLDCVEYRDNFLPKELKEDALKKILDEVKFDSVEDTMIVLAGKKIKIPRRQVGYGDVKTSFRYTGTEVEARDWSKAPTLFKIKEYIIKKLGCPVNYVLVNLYRDGSDYIGWHSDNEKDLDTKYPIISLTLGEARPFRFKHKVFNKVYEGILKNNSLVLMNPPCQKFYKHCLPKKGGKVNKRINLTFRVLRTVKK